jgi:methyl-accepting chemotaxis protein
MSKNKFDIKEKMLKLKSRPVHKVKSLNPGFSKIKFGILQKLIIGFIIPVIFIVVLGIISYSKASEGLISNYKQATNNTVSMASGYLDYVLGYADALTSQYTSDRDLSYFTRGLSHTEENDRNSYIMQKNTEFLKKVNLEKFIGSIHIICGKDIPVLTTEYKKVAGFYDELSESEEGKLLKDEDTKSYWVGNHPLIDEKLGMNAEDYAFAVIRKFSMDGACVVIDINKVEVETFLKGLELGDSSIVGLITGDGKEVIINHSSQENSKENDGFNFSSQNFFTESMSEKETSGSQYVNYKSQKYLYMYSKIGSTGMAICGLIPQTSFMKQAGDIRLTTIIIVVLACLVAVTIGVIMSNGIGRTLKSINKKLQQISEGDLTVQVSVKRKDEFAVLAHSITDMLNHMRELIQKMTFMSGLVSASSVNVMEASKSITVSNDNITKAVDEISHGIEGQAEDSQNCLLRMDELSEKITIVNQNLNDIVLLTDNLKEIITNGISTMENLTKQSEETNNITKYVVDNIAALEVKTNSINDIVRVINDIADQTNLLSLNASIEAARAGEHGRGFAVVADEIRKLANMSVKSANEIKGVINEITKQTTDTVATAKEAENVVSAQNDIVDHTIDAFKNINSGIEQLVDKLNAIDTNMKNMESAREGTLNAVENISAISEETLATSNNIESAVHDQSDSISVLEKAATEMGENAKDLNEAVNIFRI